MNSDIISSPFLVVQPFLHRAYLRHYGLLLNLPVLPYYTGLTFFFADSAKKNDFSVGTIGWDACFVDGSKTLVDNQTSRRLLLRL